MKQDHPEKLKIFQLQVLKNEKMALKKTK